MPLPKVHSRRGGVSRVRWLLTMSTAVALAFVITQYPSSGRQGRRELVEDAHTQPGLLAGSRSSSRAAGGGRGVAAALTTADTAQLAADNAAGAAVAGVAAQAATSGRDIDSQQQQTQQEQEQQEQRQQGSQQQQSTRPQPQLPGRAACVAAATTMAAPVHGWVSKAGALPMHLLDGPQTPARHKTYFRWRDSGNLTQLTQEVLVNGKPARVGRAPPLFPYCRVLVNHAYRTLYLKAPKTGSTSLLKLLGSCMGGKDDKPTCFQPLPQLASVEQYEALYRDYFVFTVVRNPWTRAVSSYRMLLRYMLKSCEALVGGWNRVCADLNHLGRLHHSHPEECMIDKQQAEGFAMHHLIAQAPCLTTGGGEWAADYVVRMEHLQEDMRGVLKQMDERRLASAPALDVDELLSHLTNVNKVHVACREGLTVEEVQLQTPMSHDRRRRLLGARFTPEGKPNWMEAQESYCNDAQYYLGPHAACFDSLKAYYAHDVKLLGLPQCDHDPTA